MGSGLIAGVIKNVLELDRDGGGTTLRRCKTPPNRTLSSG